MAARHRGVAATAAGTGINLALGVLYAWSLFSAAIRDSVEAGGEGAFRWDLAALNDPYALCCLVFAFTMIAAGRCQDVFGPRLTAVAGGLLVGAGFLWAAQTTSYAGWMLGFGVLAGAGIAFGYSSATPPTLKWFSPKRTGLVAGVVVSGFGLASVYIAPLAQWLIHGWGLATTMRVFGVGFLAAVTLLALFLVNPPPGFQPPEAPSRRRRAGIYAQIRERFVEPNLSPGQLLRSPSFWLLWALYFVGAGAGLMVIGSVAGMAKQSLGVAAFAAVALLAVGNAGGRIAAGLSADRLGAPRTLAGVFLVQALTMFAAVAAIRTGSALPLVAVATLIGFNYGANLSLFPALTKDLGGVRNFGVNYGLVFSAWGMGGFVMSRASQSLAAATGSFDASFFAAGALLLGGTALACRVRNRKAEQVAFLRAQIEAETQTRAA